MGAGTAGAGGPVVLGADCVKSSGRDGATSMRRSESSPPPPRGAETAEGTGAAAATAGVGMALGTATGWIAREGEKER